MIQIYWHWLIPIGITLWSLSAIKGILHDYYSDSGMYSGFILLAIPAFILPSVFSWAVWFGVAWVLK